MKIILSQTIFMGFVLAVYFAIEMLRKRDMKYKENKMFVLLSICSAIWSFGFYGVIMQTMPSKAYFWRGLGMIGTFGFLIAAQFLICYLSHVKKIYCYLAQGFSLLGIILYFPVVQRKQATYKLSEFGMSYSFTPGLWNNLYTWYAVVVAFNQCMIILYMIKKAKVQREKVLAKKLMMVEVMMVFGMVLDTIFPMFGLPALPGSTIAQFAGLAMMYHSISFVNHSRITVDNMSEFIYYSLDVPVLVFDAKGKLQIMNDTASYFLRIARDEMDAVVFERIFEAPAEEVFEFVDNSQSIDTYCVRNKKHCNLAVNKIFDAYKDKIGYIFVVTDLSERMKTMKQLETAMNEAEQANQAKSIFLANMSHEIRTPMNAIIGFSELLLKMNIGEEAIDHVQDIKWAAHNLLAIINDVLDISKIESGKMELIQDDYFIAPLLNDVVSIIEPQAKKKGLEFDLRVESTIPKELYGDKVRIRGILINLLNNAVKYTSEGYVRFEVLPVMRTDKIVKLLFRVSDTGCGIKEENMDTLFENFERLDQKVNFNIEGSGLGLSISKGYIEMMGGDIKVSSKVGVGSVFTVEIEQEIVDETNMKVEDIRVREALDEGRISDITFTDVDILVVDDNPINLRVAQGVMNSYGLNTDIANGGEEAVAKCKEKNYDIVFMDQMMPGLDGVEAMRQIRCIGEHYSRIGRGKIVVLTANAIKGIREELVKQGFDEYLGKPLNIDRLESLLLKYIPEEKTTIGKTEQSEKKDARDEDIKYISKTIPQIDVKLGMSHCGGELESYLKILEITCKYGEKQLEELRNLWEEKDYRGYTIKVHSLKSNAMNIGARDVSEEAKRQETAGNNGDYAYIQRNIERLLADYTSVLNKVKEVLVHYEMLPAQEKEDKPKLEERMALQVLRNIGTHIDNFNFGEVFKILEETKKYSVPDKYREVLAQTEKLMDDLAVDEIKALLEEAGI